MLQTPWCKILQSGLSGTWALPSEDGEMKLVSFLEPDLYNYINKRDGSTETVKGNWIYLGKRAAASK